MLDLEIVMDAQKTPNPENQSLAPESLELTLLANLRAMNQAKALEGAPRGGVTFSPTSETMITGTFIFPIKKTQTITGEVVEVVPFIDPGSIQ
jgi:hypothetical protein